MYCTHCGSSASTGDKYCRYCGRFLHYHWTRPYVPVVPVWPPVPTTPYRPWLEHLDLTY